MHYKSTREENPQLLSFEDTVLSGLAPDGGLYIPEHIPLISAQTLNEWSRMTFQQICFHLFSLFIDSTEVPSEDLRDLIERSYASFTHPEVTPVRPIGSQVDGLFLLELFHGPTFAFKDVALQFLGNLFEYFLERKNDKSSSQKSLYSMTVLGATSGDTGGAAIYGLRNKRNIQVFILHPHRRISLIQEAQMTTVLNENVFNVAVDGTFDDCQDAVKALFRDADFKAKHHLGAINSINWARILAQISYYFYSYFSVWKQKGWNTDDGHTVDYAVPTGNFGDILAGYYAKRMGLPINRLIIATNANDILHRFFETGRYERQGVNVTLSPAMDIQISSNFERFLWYLAYEVSSEQVQDDDIQAKRLASLQVKAWMDDVVSKKNGLVVNPAVLGKARHYFGSVRVNDGSVLETIRRYHDFKQPACAVTLDPHTAIGVKAAEVYRKLHSHVDIKSDQVTVCLATAHPGKFLTAVQHALAAPDPRFEDTPSITLDPELERKILQDAADGKALFEIPHAFIGILDRPKRCLRSAQAPEDIKHLVEKTLEEQKGQ